jgi:hypothetical protein
MDGQRRAGSIVFSLQVLVLPKPNPGARLYRYRHCINLRSTWIVEHTTATEYIIVNSNKWTEVGSHGLTADVTDILVVNNICYFAQGDSVNIRRARWYNNSGTATYENADDGTNKAPS